MPELTITHGGQAHGVRVDRVHRIERGKEAYALAAMRRDGADNMVFRGDGGDLYIASRVGGFDQAEINDRVEIPRAYRVEFKGVKGTVLGFDNEPNGLGEVMATRGVIGAAIGGGAALAGVAVAVAKLGLATLNPLLALGIVGGLGLVGFVLGSSMRRQPDPDKLDEFAAGMELA